MKKTPTNIHADSYFPAHGGHVRDNVARRVAEKRSGKRASYRFGVAWVALNDSAGDPDALDPDVVSNLVSVALLADLFDVDQTRVGRDVVSYRARNKIGAKP